jgi:hypothetical protein
VVLVQGLASAGFQRHVGVIVGDDARRVRHQDTALPGRADIDMVNARAIISDELELVPRLQQKPRFDRIGERGTRTSSRRMAAASSSRVIRVSGSRNSTLNNSFIRVSTTSGKRSVTTTLR